MLRAPLICLTLAICVCPASCLQDAPPYLLGERDLLDIKVLGVDELTLSCRIGSGGTISMPLAGQVTASGLTANELERAIAERLSNLKLVRDPQVTVFVREYQSQPLHVLGAVGKPGQYVMMGRIHLIDAIAMAGGLDPLRSGNTVTVKRSGGTDSILIDRLFEGGDPALNVALRGGDVVHVAERKSEVFYVVGEVGRPGAFDYPRQNKALLVSQAVGWAGGPARTAKSSKGVLVRHGPNGERQQFPVDVKAILAGRQPDIPVRPNDVIFIPGSTLRNLGAAFTQAVPWAAANGLVFAIP